MEALELVGILFQLACSICCLLSGIGLLCFIQKYSRLEREVRKMWAEANVIGNPLHIGAVARFANLLGVQLDGND